MAHSRRAAGTLRNRVAAYAELVRVPNLFTAPPDVLLGAALASLAVEEGISPASVAGLAVASVALYAAGTTLNDYFDAPVDAEERPERPIPSGRVARRSALALGVGLLAAGALVALLAAGWLAGAVAGLLGLVVLLYDGALKGGPAGFLAMGTTRGLNVLLGTTAAAAGPATLQSLPTLPTWALGVPAVVALYVATVTAMAAEEATGANRSAVAVTGAAAVVAAALAVWTLVSVGADASPLDPGVVAGALGAGAFLALVGRALRPAYRDPVPGNVGPAVGACVLGLVLLDAAFAGVAGVGWSLAIAAFLVPAVVLSRVFDVS